MNLSRSRHRIFVVGTDQAGRRLDDVDDVGDQATHRLDDVIDVGAFPFYSVRPQMFDKPLGNSWTKAARKFSAKLVERSGSTKSL